MTTQKQLRNPIRCGIANDGNALNKSALYDLANNRDKVDTSCGVYGINGALIRDRRDGELYAFVGRTSALFIVC